MSDLQEFDGQIIEHALSVIICATEQDEEVIRYLVRCRRRRDDDYCVGVAAIALAICNAIAEDRLTRWQFDPCDFRYQNGKDIEAIPYVRRCTIETKRRLLKDIVGAYRKRCLTINDEQIAKFNWCREWFEVEDTIADCLQLGIFVRTGKELGHRHSWVKSKNVFEAMNDALGRIRH